MKKYLSNSKSSSLKLLSIASLFMNLTALSHAQTLDIITLGSTPLNKNIHSSNAIDISLVCLETCGESPNKACFNWEYFDVNSTTAYDIVSPPVGTSTYTNLLKDLNFSSLSYAGGSTSFYEHYPLATTGGYDLVINDFVDCGPFTPCGDPNLELYNLALKNFPNSFFEDYVHLINNASLRADLIMNTSVDVFENDGGSLLDEIERKIDYVKFLTSKYPLRIQMGLENVLGNHSCAWGVYPYSGCGNAPGLKYKKYTSSGFGWYQSLISDYPTSGMIYSFDAAPTSLTKDSFDDWNSKLITTGCNGADNYKVKGQEGRIYIWDEDAYEMEFGPGPQTFSLTAIDAIFGMSSCTSSIDDFITNFYNKFNIPLNAKAGIWQWGIKGSNKIMDKTMLGSIYISRYYKWMIDHNVCHPSDNKFIPFACYYNLKDLIEVEKSGSTFTLDKTNSYETLKLIGRLFAGTYNVYNYTLSPVNSNVYVVTVGSGSKHVIMLINESDASVSISALKINGVPLNSSVQVKLTSLSTTCELTSALCDFEPVPFTACNFPSIDTPIILPKYSENIIEFNKSLYCFEDPHGRTGSFIESEILLFPNPAFDYLNIDFQNMPIEYITISNAMGEVVLALHSVDTEGHLEIDISTLPQGIYFAELKATNGQSINKQFNILR